MQHHDVTAALAADRRRRLGREAAEDRLARRARVADGPPDEQRPAR